MELNNQIRRACQLASEKTKSTVALSMVAYHSGAYQSIQWTIDKGNGYHLARAETLGELIDKIDALVIPTESEQLRTRAELLLVESAALLDKAKTLEGGAA